MAQNYAEKVAENLFNFLSSFNQVSAESVGLVLSLDSILFELG